MAQATKVCRKPEIKLRLLHEIPALRMAKTAGVSFAAAKVRGKRRQKKFSTRHSSQHFDKSRFGAIESKEIQGNPLHNQGIPATKRRQSKTIQTVLSGPWPRKNKTHSIQCSRLVIGPGGLCRLQAIEGAGRRLLGRQTNGPRIVERPLGAGMKFGPARRLDGVRRGDPHRRT